MIRVQGLAARSEPGSRRNAVGQTNKTFCIGGGAQARLAEAQSAAIEEGLHEVMLLGVCAEACVMLVTVEYGRIRRYCTEGTKPTHFVGSACDGARAGVVRDAVTPEEHSNKSRREG